MSKDAPSVMAVIDACDSWLHPLELAAGRPILQWVINGLGFLERQSPIFVITDCEPVYQWLTDYASKVHSARTIRTYDVRGSSADLSCAKRLLTSLALAKTHFNLSADVALFRRVSAPLIEGRVLHEMVTAITSRDVNAVLPIRSFTQSLWTCSGDSQAPLHFVELPSLSQPSSLTVDCESTVAVRTSAYEANQGTYRDNVIGVGCSEIDTLELTFEGGPAIADAVFRRRIQQSRLQQLPNPLHAVVFDFDGVFTDNRVWVTADGQESAACSRGDGMGIGLLKKTGVPLLVLSKEPVPIVQHRCKKLGLECLHGVDDKLPLLERWLADRGLDLAQTVYVGNDVNDHECLAAAGCGVVPADALPQVMPLAKIVLDKAGGHGAVRELCDLIIAHLAK